ncbi:unnamed protein product [Dicrocoelium dendriticum]|nr:unnamed protein product [Dicrocoelium dendriticum]
MGQLSQSCVNNSQYKGPDSLSQTSSMGNICNAPQTLPDSGTSLPFPNGLHASPDAAFQTLAPTSEDSIPNRSPIWLPPMNPESLLNLLRPYLLSQLCPPTSQPTDLVPNVKFDGDSSPSALTQRAPPVYPAAENHYHSFGKHLTNGEFYFVDLWKHVCCT